MPTTSVWTFARVAECSHVIDWCVWPSPSFQASRQDAFPSTINEQDCLSVDWDSHDAQKKFTTIPAHDSMVQKLRTLAEGIHVHHALFTHFPPSIADTSPVTEFATFYNAENGFKENAKKFIDRTMEVMRDNGGLGSVLGETIEGDVVKHVDQRKGVEGGKAVVLLIGWESKEAHMRFRETGVFKENVALLREKCSGAEMVSLNWLGGVKGWKIEWEMSQC